MANPQTIEKEGRYIVKEDILARKNKLGVNALLILFNDALLYCKVDVLNKQSFKAFVELWAIEMKDEERLQPFFLPHFDKGS